MNTGNKRTMKDSKAIRWGVLVLVSSLFFATYWFQDVFSPLKDLMDKNMGIDSASFGVVISATTWANCLGMILVGGIILDKWGIRLSAAIFGLLVTTGGFLTTLGASDIITQVPSVKIILMAAGRIVFGIGLEITCVIVSKVVVKWFRGKELALAMAINVGFGRLGSFFAVSFSLDIANNQVMTALGTAASMIGAAFIFLLVYLILDKRLDNQLQATEEEEEEKFRVSDFFKLVKNPTFLWIATLCVVYYSAVFPFIGAYGPSILHSNFGFTLEQLSIKALIVEGRFAEYLTSGPKITGLIPLGSIVFTPIFGSLIDRKGKAASMMLLGAVLLIFAHVTLAFSSNNILAYAALFCLGVAFSLVPAAMWPSVAKIVPQSRLGTAYASMFTIQNWGLALFYWLPGFILAKSGENYTAAVSPFLILGFVSIICAIQLKRSTRKHGYGLEEPFGN